MKLHVGYFVVLLCVFVQVYTQQNAGSSVASSLIECYNTSEVLQPDRRLPASMNVLIALIRRIEDGRTSLDARQLSIELIQRFRQDGIIRSSTGGSQFTLPFTPSGVQAEKNRILLRDLIPGTAVNFPNETLTVLERCSIHFMLSSTVNTTIRGDEGTVCNRLGRYERRVERSVASDAEVFDPKYLDADTKGNLEEGEEPPAEPVAEEEAQQEPEVEESADPSEDAEPFPSGRATSTTSSACPVEGGVVFTRWGAVTAGTVIAGVAAGLEPQQIAENSNLVIDSRFAATLVGDLTEASLFQAISNIQTIGASGGWNNTQVPRWYFITSQERYEMTDADIRAGLDGLIIARNVQAWRARFPTIRLSQILDMYYSRRGVFNSTHRACNRNFLLNEVAPRQDLITQTTAFSVRFDRYATLPGTILGSQIPNLSNRTVELFLNYAPSLNDLSCLVDVTPLDRTATDLIIFVDTQWQHAVINPAISHLLDNLDINRFESNFTLINGNDGRVIINSTNTILSYHQQFNITVQQNNTNGFQFSSMINQAEQIVRQRMDSDRVTGEIGGRSIIILFVPFQATVTPEDSIFATERREVYRSFLPDIRFLVLGLGTPDSYGGLVSNVQTDVFTLPDSSDGTSIVNAVTPVVERIRNLPRRIVNPLCGSDFSGGNSAHSMLQFVEPQTIIFYRIAANYFHGEGDRLLRITGQGDGSIVVCTSRENSNPRQNLTAGNQECRTINANEEVFSLTGVCVDGLISECGPFFFSVEAPNPGTTARCNEVGCRFPDNIRFSIGLEGFGCASGSMKIIGSFMLVTVLLAILRL